MGYIMVLTYSSFYMNQKALIHRLNRAQGQIEAIKRSLANENEKNCLETIRLIKASQNALKKFAEAYVSEHLEECLDQDVSKEEMHKGLQVVISSAFGL